MLTTTTQRKSIDPADIGPEDLWIVWFRTLPISQNLGEDPVKTKWILAAPGEEGLKHLSGPDGFGEDLVAALPVSVLKQMESAIFSRNHSKAPKWLSKSLGIRNEFILVQDESGHTRVVTTNQRLKRGEKEIIKGTQKDFKQVLTEGNRILAEKDWKKIFRDRRPFVQKGDTGWLDYQQDPQGAEIMERLFREHHDSEN